MHPILPVVAALAVLLTGCETQKTEYLVRGIKSERVNQVDAQNLLIQNYLQRHLKEPTDKPLRASTIILPPYPPSLRRAGVEGNVRVRFKIDETGAAVDPTIVGTAVPALAALAVDSVLKWKFEPITRNGKPVTLQLAYQFVFRLE